MIDFISALPEHLPVLSNIVRECIIHMEAQGIHQWDDVYPAPEDFMKDIETHSLFMIVQNDGEIGCICINELECPEYAQGEWEYSSFKVVHRLMVSPKSQSEGVGRAAMAFAEQVALTDGKKSLRLDAFTENPAAVQLYRKLGYAERGTARFRKGLFYLFEKSL